MVKYYYLSPALLSGRRMPPVAGVAVANTTFKPIDAVPDLPLHAFIRSSDQNGFLFPEKAVCGI